MIFKYYIFFILFLISSNLFAINVRVIDLEFLITENETFKKSILIIENDQIKHKEHFTNKENELQSDLERIENLKLILDDENLSIEIKEYKEKFSEFQKIVNNYNLHYEQQLNNLKNLIMQNILELVKKYSKKNNIELILDSDNYIIAVNNINITKDILIELNKQNIEFEFEQYK